MSRTVLDGAHNESPLRRDVQGLRAIAVLAVVAYHAGLPLSGGFVGVDMFFVISGFVICLTLLRRIDRDGSISLTEFYLRRFRRLFPALVFVVSVSLVVAGFVLFPIGPLETAGITGLATLFSAANIAIALTTGDYFDDSASLNPFLNMWSLGVEEQFYLVFPLAILMVLSMSKHRSRFKVFFIAGTALVSLASLTLAVFPEVFGEYGRDSLFFGFYSPIPRIWEFGVGVLVALWSWRKTEKFDAVASTLLQGIGLALILFALLVIGESEYFPNALTLLPVVGTALAIVGGHGNSGVITVALSSRPMLWFGDRSYSLYLWHWPLLVLGGIAFGNGVLTTVACLLLTLVMTTVSFRFVEQPFRTRPLPSRKTAVKEALSLISLPALLSVAAMMLPSRLWGAEMAKAIERPIGYEECHVNPLENAQPQWCEFNVSPDNSKTPVYLVGDSNAAQYTSGLLEAAQDQNRTLLVSTASACPVFTGATPVSGLGDVSQGCSDWQAAITAELSSSPRGIVVLAWSDDYFVASDTWLRTTSNGFEQDPSLKAESFERSLRDTVSSIQSAGHDVLLVSPVPHWVPPYEWNLAECSLFDAATGCQKLMPEEFFLNRSEAGLSALERVANQTQTTKIEFIEELCPDSTCRTWDGGQWVYRDHAHLSVPFARSLSTKWASALSAVD